MEVKNIILDLGGVIYDVDYNAAAEAFKKSGIKNFDELFSKKQQEHFFDDFEKGMIPDASFRNEIRKHLPNPLTDEQIDAAWNKLLIGIPPSRMDFLNSLKKNYCLFLLSNTNRIHVKAFTKILEKDFGKNVFENVFEKIYLSCNLRLRKPDAEIFNLVLEENKLIKEETIFIDDSIQHVEGAKKVGLPSYHLDLSKNMLENFLPTLNLKL